MDHLLSDRRAADSYSNLVASLEPRLRRALTSAFGLEAGRDAAAEALAYGWQHWDRISGMKNPSGYLFRVGQNAARKMSRRSTPFGRVDVGASEPWVETRFGEAWLGLSERQRVVMGLVHGFDWTLGEVAELLGVSKGTIQSYERRALQKLRRELGVEQ